MNINKVNDSSNDIRSSTIEKERALVHAASTFEENQISIKIVTNIEKTLNSKV